MEILIRVDASPKLGSGHLVRCYSLAQKLKEKGASISFVCQETYKNQVVWLNLDQQFRVFPLCLDQTRNEKEDAHATLNIANKIKGLKWIIKDHYYLGSIWESLIKTQGYQLMTLDDFEQIDHDTPDILLDQNQSQVSYSSLINTDTQILTGPQYALLRPEFYELRKIVSPRNRGVQEVLIFFQGKLATKLQVDSLRAIRQVFSRKPLRIYLISSENLPSNLRDEIQHRSLIQLQELRPTPDMAHIMSQVDLYIGHSGSLTWERCCLKLPGIVVSQSQNQIQLCEYLEDRQCQIYIGKEELVSESDFVKNLELLVQDQNRLEDLSLASGEITDGQGAHRVSEILMTT